jgi:mannose/fructose/N-acetylgalactosamine-specific phosphotransferase system component IID
LAFWLGAAAFFSVALAPVLFAVLPTRTLAGEVVGRVLPGVLYSGIVVGGLIITIEVALRRAWSWRGREVLGALIVAACAIAEFIVGPRIARLRAEATMPIDSLPVDDARRMMFGRLHGVSVAWLGVAMLAAAIALVLSARTLESRN